MKERGKSRDSNLIPEQSADLGRPAGLVKPFQQQLLLVLSAGKPRT